MNVLVSGGVGYIGSVVTDILCQRNYNVRVYDELIYDDIYLKDVDFVRGDIRDKNKLKKELDWADCFIHLAAMVGDPVCSADPFLAQDINRNCVLWAADNFKGRFIFASTCSVYGQGSGVLDENSLIKPLSVYAQSKWAAEQFVDGISFRLGTLFGIGDPYSRIRMDLAVNYMTVKAFFHKQLTVYGGGQWRPFLHVRDAAQAMCDAVEQENKGVYNLAAENITITEVAEKILAKVPRASVWDEPLSFHDARDYRVSAEKARLELGFDPKISVDEGILEILKLCEEGRIKRWNTPRFNNAQYVELIRTYYG